MTVEEVEKAAAEFQFVGGFSLWQPRVFTEHEGIIARLWLQLVIPDSTDVTGKTTQVLRTSVELDSALLSTEERTPERYVADALRKFFLHEFYESILVRGERLFDPHDARAHHPGAL